MDEFDRLNTHVFIVPAAFLVVKCAHFDLASSMASAIAQQAAASSFKLGCHVNFCMA